MATEIIGRGLIEVIPDFRRFGPQLLSSMRVARTQLDGSARGLRAAAGTVVPAMAKIGKSVTLVGAGVAIATVKMAGDFEAETAVLQTAAGETAKNLTVVRKGILDISKGTGTGLKNLTDGMYTIEKAGFRGAKGLTVLKAAAQGAKEENADLADVTNAMTSVMASYHLGADKSVQVMNALKTSAGEGKITMEEFSSALSTVLPIASANKVSFEEVGGAIATLTQHGTSAREATQELASTIRSLAAPNNVAIREFARFGLSAQDVSLNLGKRGLTGTFELMTSTILKRMGPSGKILMDAFEGTKQSAHAAQVMLSKMPPAVRDLAKSYLDGKIDAGDWTLGVKSQNVAVQPMLKNFKTLVDRSRGFSQELKKGGPETKTYTDALRKMSGGAIGLNTILQLSGESQAGFQERVKKTGESFHHATKDVEGWSITQNLFNTRMQRLKQTMVVLAIQIGTKLMPAFSAIAGFFADHQGVALALVGAIAGLAGAFAAAYVGMKLYAAYTAIAAAAQWVFNTSMTVGRGLALGTRIELIALAVAQKAVAVAQYIVTAATWAWSVALNSTGIPLLIVAIAALVAAIIYVAVKTTWFQTAWKYTWNAIKVAALYVWHALEPMWKGIVLGFQGMMAAAKAVWNWLAKWWPLVVSLITGPIGFAVVMVIRHWKAISDGVSSMFHTVVGFFTRLGTAIGSAVGGFATLLYTRGRDILLGMLKGTYAVAVTMNTWFITNVIKPIIRFFAPAVQWLYTQGRNIILGLIRGNLAVARTLGSFFMNNVIRPVINFFRNAGTMLYQRGRDMILGLIRGNLAVARGIAGWFRNNVINPAVGAFKNAAGWLYGRGKDLISGLISGAKRGLSAIGGWAKDVFKAVVGAIKKVFGIKSPSTVMAGLGGHMMSGLLKGLLRGSAALRAVVKKIFTNPLSAAKGLIKAGINVTGFIGKGAAALTEKLFGTVGNVLGGLSGGTSGANQRLGKIMMQAKGWSADQWPALRALWMGESGWRANAHNASSGAHGIPQSLPASKMRSAGADYMTNPATQIKWGLQYIKSRYGSPGAAYSAWLKRSPHWYDRGGLASGAGFIPKLTSAPERILSPSQTDLFEKVMNTASTGGGGGTGGSLTVNVYVGTTMANRDQIGDAVVVGIETARRKGYVLPKSVIPKVS